MGPAGRPDVCPEPTAGASVRLVCVAFFSLSRAGVTLGVVLTTVRAAFTLLLVVRLGIDSCGAGVGVGGSTGEHRGGVCGINKVWTGLMWEGTRSCFGKLLPRLGWRG